MTIRVGHGNLQEWLGLEMLNNPSSVRLLIRDGMVAQAKFAGSKIRQSDGGAIWLKGMSTYPPLSLPKSGNLTSGVSPDVRVIGLDGTNSGVGLDLDHGASVISSVFEYGAPHVIIDDQDFSAADFNFISRSLSLQGCVVSPISVNDPDSAIENINILKSSLAFCGGSSKLIFDSNHFVTSSNANFGQVIGILMEVISATKNINSVTVANRIFQPYVSSDYDFCVVLVNETGSWSQSAPASSVIVGRRLITEAAKCGLLESLYEAVGCRLHLGDISGWSPQYSLPLNSSNMTGTGFSQAEIDSGGFLFMRGWPSPLPVANDFRDNSSRAMKVTSRIQAMAGGDWSGCAELMGRTGYSGQIVGKGGAVSNFSRPCATDSGTNLLCDPSSSYSFLTNDAAYDGYAQNYVVNRWLYNDYEDSSETSALPWSTDDPSCFKHDWSRRVVDGFRSDGKCLPGLLNDRGYYGNAENVMTQSGRRGLLMTNMPFMNSIDGDTRSRFEPASASSPRWPHWFQPDLQTFTFTSGGASRQVQLPSIWNDNLINFYVGNLDSSGMPTFDGNGFVQYLARKLCRLAKNGSNATSESIVGERFSREIFNLSSHGNLVDYLAFDFVNTSHYDKTSLLPKWFSVIHGYGLVDEWLVRMSEHPRWSLFSWNEFTGIQSILEAGSGRFGGGLVSPSGPNQSSISEVLRYFAKSRDGIAIPHPMLDRFSLVVSLLEAEVFRLIAQAFQAVLYEELCMIPGTNLEIIHTGGSTRLDVDTSYKIDGFSLVTP